jgi:hypothetical protein
LKNPRVFFRRVSLLQQAFRSCLPPALAGGWMAPMISISLLQQAYPVAKGFSHVIAFNQISCASIVTQNRRAA